MRDLITNSINAPAGKHPAVLTFDDSTAGQFNYIINDDGTTTIDPDSGVAIFGGVLRRASRLWAGRLFRGAAEQLLPPARQQDPR